MITIPVELGGRSYSVFIEAGLLQDVGHYIAQTAGGRKAYIVTDSSVGPIFAQSVRDSLSAAGYNAHIATFPAGESHKTLATVALLFDQIFAFPDPPDRDSVIVSVGGGVVGDLAGFVAATLLRGVNFVQIPTTLLADVDSSVGGKTGVDHPRGKNLVGVFHQPRAVLIDPNCLRTLPRPELVAGLGECVKHGIIRDASLVDWIDANSADLLAMNEDKLTQLITRNVQIKSAVVSADEREKGERAHLNYGHTIGHAIEAMEGFEHPSAAGEFLRHGECVALGMVAVNHIAVVRKKFKKEDAQRIEHLLVKLDLPTRFRDLNAQKLLDLMRHDKKARGSRLHFVLPTSIGKVELVNDVKDDEIISAIHHITG